MITTKTGDSGTTRIKGQKITKASCLIECLGAIDTLVSSLGVAKAHCPNNDINIIIEEIQSDLFIIGSVLSKFNENWHTYKITEETIDWITGLCKQWDKEDYPKDFHIQGSSIPSSFFDLARSMCRTAERTAWEYGENHYVEHTIYMYLNRLSDLLWLFARELGDKTKSLKSYRGATHDRKRNRKDKENNCRLGI